jgi:predicted dehydrogenase
VLRRECRTLAQNRRDYGAEIFTTDDYRQLLGRELDAVIIATPDFLHETHAAARSARKSRWR